MSVSNATRDRALIGWKSAAWAGRLLVGGLFIFAAGSKILDPLKFAEEIRAYDLAPVLITNAIAIVLPWIELIAAALLIVGFWRAEARFIILAMTVVFTAAKVSVAARGLDINCGCWSNDWMDATFHGVWGILLNLALIGLLLVDYYSQRVGSSAVRPPERELLEPEAPGEVAPSRVQSGASAPSAEPTR